MPGRSACSALGLAQHVDAAAIGHADVRDQQIEGPLPQRREGLRAVLGRHHVVALARQHDGEELAHRPLVVDDQDARGRVGHDLRCRRGHRLRRSGGRRQAADAPPAPAARRPLRCPAPGVDCTDTRPPWSVTMRRTMARPSPLPCRKPLWNGWNIRSMSAGAMPTPSSRTDIRSDGPDGVGDGVSAEVQDAAVGHRLDAVGGEVPQHLAHLRLVDVVVDRRRRVDLRP